MIINRIYDHQNLLSLLLVFFLVELRTYQYPWYMFYIEEIRLTVITNGTENQSVVVNVGYLSDSTSRSIITSSISP
jgi:hypothetical protein